MEPPIYTIATVPMITELGPATEVEEGELCPSCNRQPPPSFSSVELVFDVWDGEDMVMAMDVYAVSERLREAIERTGLSGAQVEDIKVSKGEYFELGEDVYAPDIPRFYRLVFTGSATGPELWWTSEYCADCELVTWERTDAGTEAELALAFGEPAPPRRVYRSSWSGDDFFRLEDPGKPLVTERAKQLFESPPVKGVTFQPAEWVDG